MLKLFIFSGFYSFFCFAGVISLAEDTYNDCDINYYYETKCIDNPKEYSCACSYGSWWNSDKCMLMGVDSSIVIPRRSDKHANFATVERIQAFESFQMSFWIKLNAGQGNVLLVYSEGTLFLSVRVVSGKGSQLQFIFGNRAIDFIPPGQSLTQGQWTPVLWTQYYTEAGSRWSSNVYWNISVGSHQSMFEFTADATIFQKFSTGGRKIKIGAPEYPEMEPSGFIGEFAHLNMWNYDGGRTEEIMDELRNHCLLRLCGNIVRWTDFRAGLQGDARLKWPSDTRPSNCLDNKRTLLRESCETICSVREGRKCPQESASNVLWPRMNGTARLPCPGLPSNTSRLAIRVCKANITNSRHQPWGKEDISACISDPIRELMRRKEGKPQHIACISLEEDLDACIYAIRNNQIASVADLAKVIDFLNFLVQLREENLSRCSSRKELERYANNMTFAANELMASNFRPLWNLTVPAGEEGRRLLLVLDQAYGQVLRSANNELSVFFNGKNALVQPYDHYKTIVFSDETNPTQGSSRITVNRRTQIASEPAFVKICTAIYPTFSAIVPYANPKYWMLRTAEVPDEIGPVSRALLHVIIANATRHESELHFSFDHTMRTKEQACFSLDRNPWNNYSWHGGDCELVGEGPPPFTCRCKSDGIFAAVATKRTDPIPKVVEDKDPLKWPSMIGNFICCVSAFATLMLLMKFKTITNTSAIHKNFALAVALAELILLTGFERYSMKLLCKCSAVLLHYLVLASASWLMNEAFNLYILITYAAHAHTTQTESSMLRYYLMGWVMPIPLVGTFFGLNSQTYMAADMCWINREQIWLFYGPIVAINGITMLVLIFTTKEHRESAYTKDEKANQAISIQNRAIWSQIILLSVTWAFAYLAFGESSKIIHSLYGFFNSLRGIFLVVFYFFLNDEVRAKLHKSPKYLLEYVNVETTDEEEEANCFIECNPQAQERNSVAQPSGEPVEGDQVVLEEMQAVKDHLQRTVSDAPRRGMDIEEFVIDPAFEYLELFHHQFDYDLLGKSLAMDREKTFMTKAVEWLEPNQGRLIVIVIMAFFTITSLTILLPLIWNIARTWLDDLLYRIVVRRFHRLVKQKRQLFDRIHKHNVFKPIYDLDDMLALSVYTSILWREKLTKVFKPTLDDVDCLRHILDELYPGEDMMSIYKRYKKIYDKYGQPIEEEKK